jgi:DNA polymerase I-like protein with 3'-5' exonuclease and polymerase domains
MYSIHAETLKQLAEDSSLNPRSSQQIGNLIYDVLRFPVRKHQTEGGTSTYNTDEETLEELMLLHGEENKKGDLGKFALEETIACRKIDKVIQFLSTPIHPNGRFRTSYKLHGTETGRSSGGKSADYVVELESEDPVVFTKMRNGKLPNYGNSLQTIPKHGFKIGDTIYGKDIRKMFIPTPGYVFVEIDLSQAEARVDAVLANDLEFLPRFDTKPGVHCLTGSWLYNCDPNDIKKGTHEYHLAKTVRHAGERNMTPPRLVGIAYKNHIVVPLEEAGRLLDKFHATQPKIRGVFHKDIVDFLRQNRYLVAPNGRRRDFFARLDQNLYNEGISYLPQAVVSDQLKDAMLDTLYALYDEITFRYLAEMHDGCLAEVLEDDVELYANTFKELVEREIDFSTCSLPRDYKLSIPCEIEFSCKSWYDMKPLEMAQ